MKTKTYQIAHLALCLVCFGGMTTRLAAQTNAMGSQMLPTDFEVYVKGDTVINHPAPGFEKRILPTINHYTGKDGGYVALYTLARAGSVYGVGDEIYVVGQLRVQG